MKTITTKCLNGILKIGDLVIATPDDDYGCLIGRVMQINLLGTPEHEAETDNETDDVHVNFLEYDYSKKRIKEIEAICSELYREKRSFDEYPLDDVIMSPNCLIRITDIGDNQIKTLLHSGYNAACYCYSILSGMVDRIKPEDETITQHIFDVTETALTLAGFEVMDGDRYSFIVRHGSSDTDYEIKINELA